MRHLPSERLTRSENSHTRGALGNASFQGVVLDRDAIDLHTLQCFGILRPQTVGEPTDTSANRSVRLRAGFRRRSELGREGFQCLELRPSAPLSVDHGVSERSIKPCDRGFVAPKLVQVT